MGGMVPRKVREQVLDLWVQGLPRQQIAKKTGVGEGTVTGIVDEARSEGFRNIDLLRILAVKLRKDEIGPGDFAFAVRLQRSMKDNDMNEAQLESIISDFSGYCFKNNIEPDRLIYATYNAFALAERAGIRAHDIQEYINKGRKTIDELQLQRQKVITQRQAILEEINDQQRKLNEYKKNGPLIKMIKEQR